MARDLVTQKGVGERADAVWKELQRHSSTVGGPATVVEGLLPAETELEVVAPVETEEIWRLPMTNEMTPPSSFQNLAQFSAAVRKATRRPAYRNEDQLSLGF
jgi:hypothetical protein